MIQTDLAVIGSGMAGICAAAFSQDRGICFVQAGLTSELSFASGCLDLLGIVPRARPHMVTRPLEDLDRLKQQRPGHPYAVAGTGHIKKGFETFTAFMEKAGIPYHIIPGSNQHVITPAGTLKPTYASPLSMAAAHDAISENKRILIVDIKGLKGFSSRQMAMGLKGMVPGIKSATVAFPGRENQGDLMCERLTWDLETPDILTQFAARIRPHAENVYAVGIPAILGIYRFEELRQKIERIIKARVFEVPTLAPSVTGMRIKEAFLGRLSLLGIRHFSSSVTKIDLDRTKKFVFNVSQGLDRVEVRSDFLILATGRFMGGGLEAENGLIKEPLFDLPVFQPGHRSQWFSRDFFDPRGHGVNQAGIETDSGFRPVNSQKQVYHKRLYAAGSILAHQDWKREKSGAGISIASAHKAVSAIARELNNLK